VKDIGSQTFVRASNLTSKLTACLKFFAMTWWRDLVVVRWSRRSYSTLGPVSTFNGRLQVNHCIASQPTRSTQPTIPPG